MDMCYLLDKLVITCTKLETYFVKLCQIVPLVLQRVLQKQASMNKRLSTASAMSDPEPLLNSHVVQQVPTKSHTETAV
jgi:hypothetical protein